MKEIFKRWLAALRAASATAPAATTPPASGIDLNTLYDSQTEAVMKRVLDRRSSCIDVGCHQGAILDVMLRLAPEGTHFAFEPLPHLFAALARKYAIVANVRLHEVALSESPVAEIKVRLAKLDDVLPADASAGKRRQAILARPAAGRGVGAAAGQRGRRQHQGERRCLPSCRRPRRPCPMW